MAAAMRARAGLLGCKLSGPSRSAVRSASSVAAVTGRPASATFHSGAVTPLLFDRPALSDPEATDWPARRCSAICAGDSVTAVPRSAVVLLPASTAATCDALARGALRACWKSSAVRFAVRAVASGLIASALPAICLFCALANAIAARRGSTSSPANCSATVEVVLAAFGEVRRVASAAARAAATASARWTVASGEPSTA